MNLNKKEREMLDTARVARLATVDAHGLPHNVPICPLLENGKIYFGSDAGAKKTRNIAANPNVALVMDDYTEAWSNLHGILVHGRARKVDRKTFRAIRRKIYAKYLQFESVAPLEEGKAVIFEVTLRKKFSWGLK